MTDHRDDAEALLEVAHLALDNHEEKTARTVALMALAHAVLASQFHRCRSCGYERPLIHEDWCPVGLTKQGPRTDA